MALVSTKLCSTRKPEMDWRRKNVNHNKNNEKYEGKDKG